MIHDYSLDRTFDLVSAQQLRMDLMAASGQRAELKTSALHPWGWLQEAFGEETLYLFSGKIHI
jgi:hypothetical protein